MPIYGTIMPIYGHIMQIYGTMQEWGLQVLITPARSLLLFAIVTWTSRDNCHPTFYSVTTTWRPNVTVGLPRDIITPELFLVPTSSCNGARGHAILSNNIVMLRSCAVLTNLTTLQHYNCFTAAVTIGTNGTFNIINSGREEEITSSTLSLTWRWQ